MDTKIKTLYNEIIDKYRPILLTVAGSALVGLASGDKSDRDEIGVYVEPMEEIAGLSGSDQGFMWRSAEARTGNKEEPSKAGDVDLTIYGLRKFVRLALGGNPTIMNVLFAPANTCVMRTEIGKQLQELAPSFVSKQAGRAFLGYLNQQRLQLMVERGQKRVNRPGLDSAYGFDIKYATHMLRLGIQGKELLNTGKISIPMNADSLTFLQGVRGGNYNLDTCLDEAQIYETNIKSLLDISKVQATPDYDKVEAWLLSVYREGWKSKEELHA